ncbi:MAG: ketoacyl-ACP synthase III [Armatimonadetes bacterium]|nr:ketoacyl-ACP synthase III [Armatimonadota bacterium]
MTGIGHYTPPRVVTNHQLEAAVETSDEWIVTRTGIRERRIASDDQATSDLAIEAARAALADAGLTPDDLDLIIVGTASPDMIFPSTACWVQDRLGARRAGAFDLMAACSSFVYGLAQANAYVGSGMADRVLVIGAETLSKITNWKDRSTCVLFGDGAGAVVVQPCPPGEGFLSFHLGADGSRGDLLNLRGGGSRHPASYETIERDMHYIYQNGREVFKFAVRAIPDAIEAVLRQANLTGEAVRWYVPHQANIRIIEAAAKRLGEPLEKFIINIDRYGNTSSASVPVALSEAMEAGREQPGDVLVLVAFGGGLTWASCALRWTKARSAPRP